MNNQSRSPCPFCGSTDLRIEGILNAVIRCNTCLASGPQIINSLVMDVDRAGAANSRWNHRITARAARRAATTEMTTQARDKANRLLGEYAAGMWDAETLPDKSLSTSEQITVALGISRPDLMPDGWDPLTAYKTRLDDRQRHLVDQYRGWSQ